MVSKILYFLPELVIGLLVFYTGYVLITFTPTKSYTFYDAHFNITSIYTIKLYDIQGNLVMRDKDYGVVVNALLKAPPHIICSERREFFNDWSKYRGTGKCFRPGDYLHPEVKLSGL